MDSSDAAKPPTAAKECVKVAVNIRPLISNELLCCTDCITGASGLPGVQIGSQTFTYDHVYGGSATPSSAIFEECVAPLVDALFNGYNATVLAYGQTGSGKTYTMGANYNGEDSCEGIIPQVVQTIFRNVERLKETTEFLVRTSFIEIFNEEIYDLLDPNANTSLRAEAGSSLAKTAIPSRVAIQIRETATEGITLPGVTEVEVRSKEEMATYLTRGSLVRATRSTNMNSQSSRSHAIFTILLRHKKSSNEVLSAKLHLVDLAGSERANRAGASVQGFKEGIYINRSLLALGTVINALGDEKRRKGGHVPYRDSKLTRLLQDSLGGNSKTVMIACISPADTNAEESIKTLQYASRVRNIQNKAVVNRGPVALEMPRSSSQAEQLQSEVPPSEEIQVLLRKVISLEAQNKELEAHKKELETRNEELETRNEELRQRLHALDAQKSVSDSEYEPEHDVAKADMLESESGVGCICSQSSSCKTKRCKCRAAGGKCRSSCKCVASKCANRERGNDEANSWLVSQGTMLLRSALTEGLASRKLLSDIGNTTGCSNIPKYPCLRKNLSSIPSVLSMQDNSGATPTPRATVGLKPLMTPGNPPPPGGHTENRRRLARAVSDSDLHLRDSDPHLGTGTESDSGTRRSQRNRRPPPNLDIYEF